MILYMLPTKQMI